MSLVSAATSWLIEPQDELAPLDPPGAVTATHRPPAAIGAVTNTTRPSGLVPFDGAAGLARPAVLGPATAVPPLAAAIALRCRARARAGAALVALWPAAGDDPGPRPIGPAFPSAGTLASRLQRRGMPVRAHGRLAWLVLPADPAEAVPLLRRAEAAVGDAPTVLAIARPRDAIVDELLTGRELLVLAAPPGSPLAHLAAADVNAGSVPTVLRAPLPPGAGRLAALAGLRAPHAPPQDPSLDPPQDPLHDPLQDPRVVARSPLEVAR